ncbi:hypothetical protein [Gymnodinialimonas ulvae]|uniref:hypothetical protein n=1 Tax=Gymnodinialimonas ulvae TaxID=3126504 RepID=UPI0030B62D3D
MGMVEFRAALDVLDAQREADTPDGDVVVEALATLKPNRTALLSRDDLTRMFAACYWALDRFAEARTAEPQTPGWRAHWICIGLIEATVTDDAAGYRAATQSGVNRYLALGFDRGGKPPEPVKPVPHVPMDLEEATGLVAPYLARLEAEIAEKPYSHLKLAWDVFRRPVAPFDVVFEHWLADLDARGVGTGDSLPALREAQALEKIAQEGRQVVGWQTCEDVLLPKLEHPHPMVAGCAGKLVGSLYTPDMDRFGNTTPWPLTKMMDHLTHVQGCRRAVAGGFVVAFDEMPYLVEDLGDAFDLDAWVMEILAHPLGEPYVPGAQAFWFHVHEYYWRDVDFMFGLLDAGHDWIAYMCATEGAELALVRPVLDRIVAGETELAEAARTFIARKEKSG